MSYRALKDSVSSQSLVFYWSKHHSFEDYRVGWMVLCYPLDAAYVRKLRPAEHPLVGQAESGTAYYAAFNQFTGSCIAVGTSLAQVCALVYLKNRTPVLAH